MDTWDAGMHGTLGCCDAGILGFLGLRGCGDEEMQV